MKDLLYFFSGEFKRHIYRWNLIAWLVILVMLLTLANSTVNLLKNNPAKTNAAQQIQQKYWEKIPNYYYYQLYGINFLYVMPSTAIIANDTVIPDDLSSRIDFFSKLQIFNNLKGGAIFLRGKGIRLDFSAVIKLLIPLIVLWYGFGTFQYQDYLKSLTSIWTYRRSVIYTLISRFLLYLITFLLIMTLVFLFVRIRGITFSPGEVTVIAGYLLEAVLYLSIFFFIGALIGLLGQTKLSVILLFISWFFLAVASHWIITPTVTPEYLDTLKDYKAELAKINIIAKYEEMVQEERGKYDPSRREEGKEVAEEFWNNYYLKKIVPIEKKLKDMIARAIEKDRKISKFFPGPFFDMTANEASGRGCTNYMLFYEYSDQMQKKFVRFIIDRAFYNDPKVMVNFIKGDEDIFYGKAILPPNFWPGILIQMGYVVILIIACYIGSTKKIFPRAKDDKAFDNLTIDLKSGENFTMQDCTDEETPRPHLTNVFLGKNRELPVTILLDGKPFPVGEKSFIIFVPKPGDIPDELKGKHLVYLFKRVFNLPVRDIIQLEKEIGKKTLEKHFRKMKKEEEYKLVLLLYFLVKFPVYLFDGFAEGISDKLSQELFAIVEEKLPAGSMIIDLTVLERKWNNQQHWCAVHFKDGKYRLFKPKS